MHVRYSRTRVLCFEESGLRFVGAVGLSFRIEYNTCL